MGEAKRKGTFEIRKANSIKKQKEDAEAYKKLQAEIKANMTPEEKIKQSNAKKSLAELLAIANSFTYYPTNNIHSIYKK